eukprot:Nk52_evm16s212 gene=Nk52_evmTU16s212
MKSVSKSCTSPSPWAIWQFLDTTFPAGGLCHSCGVESAFNQGLLSDQSAVRVYLLDCLHHTAAQFLPVVRLAFTSTKNINNPSDCESLCLDADIVRYLDAFVDSFLLGSVPRKASLGLGLGLLHAVNDSSFYNGSNNNNNSNTNTSSCQGITHSKDLLEMIQRDKDKERKKASEGEAYHCHAKDEERQGSETNQRTFKGHFSVIFGVIFRLLFSNPEGNSTNSSDGEFQVALEEQETCMRAFLYLLCRTMTGAAVRVGVIGPMNGQQILCELQEVIDAYVLKYIHAEITVSDRHGVVYEEMKENTQHGKGHNKGIEELLSEEMRRMMSGNGPSCVPLSCTTSPVVELLQESHENCFSTLFTS